jgi:hypothetical protein
MIQGHSIGPMKNCVSSCTLSFYSPLVQNETLGYRCILKIFELHFLKKDRSSRGYDILYQFKNSDSDPSLPLFKSTSKLNAAFGYKYHIFNLMLSVFQNKVEKCKSNSFICQWHLIRLNCSNQGIHRSKDF